MKSYEQYKQQCLADIEKLKKVILSCRTKIQAKVAYDYFKLWVKKYEWELKMGQKTFHYMEGEAFGMLQGMLKMIKYNENR